MLIEVFKTGTHIDAKGNSKTYTTEMLDRLVYNYATQLEDNPNNLAPLVKGHPDTNEPALGWVKKLYRRGKKLIAKVDNVSEELIDEIKNDKFKYFSIALYPDMQLRHIGILGAVPPAVKDLNPNGIMSFNSPNRKADTTAIHESVSSSPIEKDSDNSAQITDDNNIDAEQTSHLKNLQSDGKTSTHKTARSHAPSNNYADAEIKDYLNKQAEAEHVADVVNQLQATNNELLKQIHDLQRQNRSHEFNAYVNSVAQNSQIAWTPAQKTAFIEILELATAAGQTQYNKAGDNVCYSEQEISQYAQAVAPAGVELTAKIKSFVESMEFAAQPSNEILTELNLSANIFPEEAATQSFAPVDPARQQIHLAALSYCQKHPNVTYSEAVVATLNSD